jgi:indolepyruvate ferredoxin oxidoreductase
MDQIGLAQKGGEVTTHIRIAASPDALGPVRFAPREADTLIGCDLAVASSPEVLSLLAEGAVAIVNDHVVMTGEFTSQPDLVFPGALMKRRIENCSDTTFADLSQLATRLLGDAVGANMMALGMAWQKGRVPVTEESILRAIELNGVAIAMNKGAFAWGRAIGDDPDAIVARMPPRAAIATTLESIVEIRAAELTRYQNEGLARRFRAVVAMTADAENRVVPGSTELAETVARAFHKLLAYKDEYEVARLHVETGFLARLAGEFDGGTIAFHLAPPLLARRDPVTGHPRKMRLGRWVIPVFRLLARLKFLRGTWADPFGHTAERKLERRMVDEYETLLLSRVIPDLIAENHALAVEIARLPLSIRGFGHVKAAAERDASTRLANFLSRWTGDGRVAVSPP